MQQTNNYGLNQWEMTDLIKMEDFNGDNSKVDAALKGQAEALAAETAAREAGDAAIAERAGAQLLKTVTVPSSCSEYVFPLDDIDWSQWKAVHLLFDPYMNSGSMYFYAGSNGKEFCLIDGNTSADKSTHTNLVHMILYPLFDKRNEAVFLSMHSASIYRASYRFETLPGITAKAIPSPYSVIYPGTTMQVWGEK